jgi:DDE superfamily endonuclease
MSCHAQLNLYLQNVHLQIVSLPNLRIVDFGYGHTGSAHDSTAWDETHLAREHTTILEGDEFVWADSAYPVELSR